MDTKYVINIGRQLGSGGHEIGKRLAAQLGIGFYDQELIDIASKESGLCKEFFERADEKANQSFTFGMRFPFINDGAIPYNNCLSNDALFKIQSDVIRELANRDSSLFVGRCADYVLRDYPRCVNIFISSSMECRVKRLCINLGISADEAEELIEKTDRRRASFYNYYSYKTWGAASTYHLCIDSSVLGTEDTTAFIKSFIEKKLEL